MELTARMWTADPADGWITWIDRTEIRSANPGYCFKKAGWVVDRDWPHLTRSGAGKDTEREVASDSLGARHQPA
jgi:hypothetical protein